MYGLAGELKELALMLTLDAGSVAPPAGEGSAGSGGAA